MTQILTFRPLQEISGRAKRLRQQTAKRQFGVQQSYGGIPPLSIETASALDGSHFSCARLSLTVSARHKIWQAHFAPTQRQSVSDRGKLVPAADLLLAKSPREDPPHRRHQ